MSYTNLKELLNNYPEMINDIIEVGVYPTPYTKSTKINISNTNTVLEVHDMINNYEANGLSLTEENSELTTSNLTTLIAGKIEDFDFTGINTEVSLKGNQIMEFSIDEPETITDTEYNVYLINDGPLLTELKFLENNINLLALSGTTSDIFHSDLDETSIDEDGIKSEYLLRRLAVKRTVTSNKLGNLKSITISPNDTNVLIASGFKRNDHLIISNIANTDIDDTFNSLMIKAIVFVPVFTSIDTIKLDELIKKSLIRNIIGGQ